MKVAGATLFVVDAGVDTGPIVAQAAVPVADTDRGTTITASAGQTTALTMPTTRPARSASCGRSMSKPSSSQASSHSVSEVRRTTDEAATEDLGPSRALRGVADERRGTHWCTIESCDGPAASQLTGHQ